MCRTRREEPFVLEDGEGLIDIRGDAGESGVLVGGVPIAFNWADCQGSIGQYLVRSADTSNLSEHLRDLRHMAAGNLESDVPLARQLRPLLRLFTNAAYRITFEPQIDDWGLIDYETRRALAEHPDNFYPWDYSLIATQPADVLQRDRVAYWQEQIRAGSRPILIATSVRSSDCLYLLDGHHKARAYEDLRVPPAVLFIVKESPCGLSQEEGVRFLGAAQQFADDYLRIKRTYLTVNCETDWFTSSNLVGMLAFARSQRLNRKLTLFACASCRLVWNRLQNNYLRNGVEVAERFADGLATADELRMAHQAAEAHSQNATRRFQEAGQLVVAATDPEFRHAYLPNLVDQQLAFLRDIVGNPFRTVAIPPEWRTHAVTDLARTMYESRDFRTSPILADALEEAGCTDAEILSHCRAPGPHVRGCWVIDLLLGKE